jgi:hypothetical protein
MKKIISNNQEPIKISISKIEVESLLNYIADVTKIKEEFKFYFGESTRFFIIWHMESVRARLINRLLNYKHEQQDKKFIFTFNLAEQKTFSFLFKKEPPENVYVLIVQNKLINGLVNTY